MSDVLQDVHTAAVAAQRFGETASVRGPLARSDAPAVEIAVAFHNAGGQITAFFASSAATPERAASGVIAMLRARELGDEA